MTMTKTPKKNIVQLGKAFYLVRHQAEVTDSLADRLVDLEALFVPTDSTPYADTLFAGFSLLEAFRDVEQHPHATVTERMIARFATRAASGIYNALRDRRTIPREDLGLVIMRMASKRLPGRLLEAPTPEPDVVFRVDKALDFDADPFGVSDEFSDEPIDVRRLMRRPRQEAVGV